MSVMKDKVALRKLQRTPLSSDYPEHVRTFIKQWKTTQKHLSLNWVRGNSDYHIFIISFFLYSCTYQYLLEFWIWKHIVFSFIWKLKNQSFFCCWGHIQIIIFKCQSRTFGILFFSFTANISRRKLKLMIFWFFATHWRNIWTILWFSIFSMLTKCLTYDFGFFMNTREG